MRSEKEQVQEAWVHEKVKVLCRKAQEKKLEG